MDVILAIIAGLGAAALATSLRILREYERAVVFRLGRVRPLRGPGLVFLVPFGVERMVRVSLRIIAMDIPPQDVITRDNVSVKVNAVLYFRVHDPSKAVLEIEDYLFATSQLAQTTLRSVIGQAELDELLAEREKFNHILQEIIDEGTDVWGIDVTGVEVKDVDLPQEMKRVIARQAEAERERRAKVINAEGELQAAARLKDAARLLSTHPASLQLRLPSGTVQRLLTQQSVLALAQAAWTHLAVVYDAAGPTVTFYVNGQPEPPVVLPEVLNGFGGQETLGGGFHDIDEFYSDDRALSAAEVQSLASTPRAGWSPLRSGCTTFFMQAVGGVPAVGNAAFAVDTYARGVPNASYLVGISFGSDLCSSFGLPLPYDLGAAFPSLAGCSLVTSQNLLTVPATITVGTPFRLPIAIPLNALPTSLYAQPLGLDASTAQLVAGDGIALAIGH